MNKLFEKYNKFKDTSLIHYFNEEAHRFEEEELEIIEQILNERGYKTKSIDDLDEDEEIYASSSKNAEEENDNIALRVVGTITLLSAILIGRNHNYFLISAFLFVVFIFIKISLATKKTKP